MGICNAGQAGAANEGSTSYGFDALADADIGHAGTVFER
jgi:hypothetical protein